jgi:DNA-binding FadR family transcriptional regulator
MERPYRRVMVELLDGVVTGEIAAAAALPAIVQLAERYGSSEQAATEACVALEGRGVVGAARDGGFRAQPDDRWSLIDRDVTHAVLVRNPSEAHVRESVEAVHLLVTQAAVLAAERATAGDVALLDGLLKQLREALDDGDGERPAGRSFADAEGELHRAFVRLSGNRFIAAMLQDLLPALATVRHQRARQRDGDVLTLLERIVGGLRDSDGIATAAAVDEYGRRLAAWVT